MYQCWKLRSISLQFPSTYGTCDPQWFTAKSSNMIIPIKRDGDIEDWAIVELQGDLEFETSEFRNDRYIGDLHFTKSGMPILIIGVHVLHGKEMVLEKPFAVLEKKHIENDEASTSDANVKTQYIIKGIVRKKVLFKSRPKPIITNVPKSI